MTPDQLRALADALEPMAHAPRFENMNVPAFCAYLRECADAKPCGYRYRTTGSSSRWIFVEPDRPTAQTPGAEALFLRPQPEAQPEKCGCRSCLTPAELMSTFVVCPKCGNKRCPRADDHRNACTDSNDPGQPQPERQPVSVPTNNKWWCPQCKVEVPPEHVTYIETHDSRCGGCGCGVLSTKPVNEPTEAQIMAGLKVDAGLFMRSVSDYDRIRRILRAALAAKETE